MRIRRPVAALFVALTLAGGPAVLTACADPSGGPNSDQRNDGTTDDESTNTSGNDENDAEQGGLPDVHDSDTDQGNEDRNEDSDNGG
ncbi:hypothetical protein [Modestobacter sp. SYSU DS0511]